MEKLLHVNQSAGELQASFMGCMTSEKKQLCSKLLNPRLVRGPVQIKKNQFTIISSAFFLQAAKSADLR